MLPLEWLCLRNCSEAGRRANTPPSDTTSPPGWETLRTLIKNHLSLLTRGGLWTGSQQQIKEAEQEFSPVVPCCNAVPRFPINHSHINHKVNEILPHTRLLLWSWYQSWFRPAQWAKKTKSEIRALARPWLKSCVHSPWPSKLWLCWDSQDFEVRAQKSIELAAELSV